MRQTDTTTPNIVGLDFGFFLKISKEIGKAWRKDLMLAKRASLTPCEARKKSLALCFQPRSRPFVLFDCSRVLEYAKIRTVLQLFCSIVFPTKLGVVASDPFVIAKSLTGSKLCA